MTITRRIKKKEPIWQSLYLDVVEGKFSNIEKRFSIIEGVIDLLNDKFDRKFEALNSKFEGKISISKCLMN